MQVSFTVPGKPVPQPRQRVARNGRMYYPDNGIRLYRRNVELAASAVVKQPFTDPVRLRVFFIFERPPSHFTKQGTLTKAAKAKQIPGRGDVSNLLKGLEDALNGLAWTDDALIATVEATKLYGSETRTEVVIDEAFRQGWQTCSNGSGGCQGDQPLGCG